MSSFCAKKTDKMNEIQDEFHRKLEDKMKKISESADLIRKLEEKKLIDYEEKKIGKVEYNIESSSKAKDDLKNKKGKGLKRFEEAKFNLSEIQKSMEIKNKELMTKLKEKKNSKSVLHHVEDYLAKRNSTAERFVENASNIKKNKEEKKMKYLEIQQIRNNRSVDKIRTLDMSKEFLR